MLHGIAVNALLELVASLPRQLSPLFADDLDWLQVIYIYYQPLSKCNTTNF